MSMFTKTKSHTGKKKEAPPKKEEIKAMIKEEIARETENKTAQDVNNNVSLYYPAQGALFDSSNTIQLSPGSTSCAINQGVANGARVGNEIRMKKGEIDMVFYPTPYDVTVNPDPAPNIVTLKLFYDKRVPSTFPFPRPDFFQLNSSSQGIIGDLRDQISPINTDAYRVLATKTFKLGYSKYDGTSFDSAQQAFSNNDYLLNKIIRWDFTKHLVKAVKYNDNLSDPVTRGLWMEVMITPSSGAIGLAGVIPVKVSYNTFIEYEDA